MTHRVATIRLSVPPTGVGERGCLALRQRKVATEQNDDWKWDNSRGRNSW